MPKKKNKSSLRLKELAEKIGAELHGDGSIVISGAAPVEKAKSGDITFIANQKYLKFLESTKASAVVLDHDTPSPLPAALRHKNPYLAFARIVDLLYPDILLVQPGIDPSAIVAPSAAIDNTSGIGPLTHIGENSRVGRHSQLVSQVYVGRNVQIGENCLIYPGVKIMDGCIIGNHVIIHASTVVGSDGFGFAESEAGLKKIKQIGWVEIGDNVEIGSNCSIDRGALGPTRIGQGTKIDNLVQIAHNVEIGRHCIIVAQVGISGSTKLGNGVVLAGQVGLVGHIELGDGVRIAAQSGVGHSVKTGTTLLGSPARDIMLAKRIEAALTRLPELLRRVKKIEDNLK